MSLFDRALNAASDAARNSAAAYNRTMRKRALTDQINQHQQVIAWSTARIGRLAIDSGYPLPDGSAPAKQYISSAEGELRQLERQLSAANAQLAALQQPAATPGGQWPGQPAPGPYGQPGRAQPPR